MKAQKFNLIFFVSTFMICIFLSQGAYACWTLPPIYQYPCPQLGKVCCNDPSCDYTLNPEMKCAFNWWCLVSPLSEDCNYTGEPDCPFFYVLNKDETKLNILRETRDTRMVRTAFGRSLIKLYYKHSLEITSILFSDDELFLFVAAVVNEIAEKAVAFNNHEKVIINNALIEDILNVADLINEKASPDLKADIQRVKKQIKSGYIFRSFGITVDD
jgi:hypothetical protein